MSKPEILTYFSSGHLPERLQTITAPIEKLAHQLADIIPPSAELSAGLRKLLEAKDCLVRAALTADELTPATPAVDELTPATPTDTPEA